MDTITPSQPRETAETPIPEGQGHGADVASQQLAGYFGVTPDAKDNEVLGEIARIIGFQIQEPAEMLWKIRHIESRIGTPQPGISRMQHLYNYVKLDAQIRGLEKQREEYGS